MFSFEINLQMQSKLQVQLKGKENRGDFFMAWGGMPVGAVAWPLK